jgi:hypothetical protein
MGDKIEAEGTHKSVDIQSYVYFKDIEGIFIRAAIRYLSELSSQNISNQLLVNEGILPPGVFQSSLHGEVIMIINYRSRIEEAVRLLTSWVREVRPGEGGPGLTRIGHRPAGYMGGLEMPIVDSILPAEVTPAMLAIMGDMGINYRIDRIPKTMPPVLSQLKLEGLHHYLAHNGEFSYQQSMELAVFMDKVVRNEDFPGDKWHVEPGEKPFIEQMKDVFRACLAGNMVTIG